MNSSEFIVMRVRTSAVKFAPAEVEKVFTPSWMSEGTGHISTLVVRTDNCTVELPALSCELAKACLVKLANCFRGRHFLVLVLSETSFLSFL